MDATSNNPAALLIAGPVAQPGPQPVGPNPANPGPVATPATARAEAGTRRSGQSEFSNTMKQLEDPAEVDRQPSTKPSGHRGDDAPDQPAAPSDAPEAIAETPAEPAPAAVPADEDSPHTAPDLFAHGGFLPENPGESLPESGKVLPPETMPQPAELTAQNPATDTDPVPVGTPVMPVSMANDADGMPIATGAESRANAAAPIAAPAAPNITTNRADAAVNTTTTVIDDGPPVSVATAATTADAQTQSGDSNARATEQQFAALKDMLPQSSSNATATRGMLVADLPNPATLVSATRPGSEFSGLLSDLATTTSERLLQPLADAREFAAGLNQRLSVMNQNGVQTARLQLYPEQLGPLEVRIQVEDDVAQVWFSAQHGQTREALEQALPRLRELFADQGLQLIRSDVGDGQPDSDEKTAGESNSDHNMPTMSRDEVDARDEFLLAQRALRRLNSRHLLDLRV